MIYKQLVKGKLKIIYKFFISCVISVFLTKSNYGEWYLDSKTSIL